MTDPEEDEKDYRWLLARERGDDIGHVLASERAPYEQLGALLSSGASPSAGWKQRVLERIDAAEQAEVDAAAAREAEVAAAAREAEVAAAAREAEVAAPPSSIVVELDAKLPPAPAQAAVGAKPAAAGPARPRPEKSPVPVASLDARRRRTRWMLAGTAVAAAAAAVLFIALPKRGADPGESAVSIKTQVIAGPDAMRSGGGETIPLGSTYVVEAVAPGPAELRVYGGSGEKLLAACSKTAQDHRCKIEGDRLRLMVLIAVPGDVSAVVFLGKDVRPTTGSYDGDMEAAAAAHVRFEAAPRRRAL